MAASYSTDLTTLTANETNGMVEPTATGWTNLNAFTSAETDYFIQGTACTSATMKVGVGGALTNNTTFTMGTDDAVLCWAYLWCPANLDTEAGDGVRQMIGTSTANFWWVTQSGSDDWLYGGWRCFAMGNPAQITTNTQGSPSGTLAYTGWAAEMLAVPGKGNPYGVDAVRVGRCQIKVTGSTGNFTEIEEFNSKNSTASRTGFTLLDSGYHRLGLFQYQNGSYLWKGKLLFGETGVTACTFVDSNKTILVENTKHVTANFNLMEIQHTSSDFQLNGITIQALGTVSRGRFLQTDNCNVDLTGCTFVDMDTFVFKSGATSDGCVFRRCGQITQGGSTFTNNLVINSHAATSLLCDNPAAVTNSDFVSDGTNHALELTTACAGNTYSLTNLTYTGYTAASSGNEAIYNNSGGHVTLNVSGGNTPTIRNGSGASTTVNATVSVTWQANVSLVGAEVRVYDLDGAGGTDYGTELAGTESCSTSTYTYGGSNGNVILLQVMKAGYVEFVQQFTVPASAQTFDITLKLDTNA